MPLVRQRLLFGALICTLLSVNAMASPVTIRSAMQDNNTMKFDPKNAQLPGVCIEIIRAVEKLDSEIKFTGLEASAPLPRIQSDLVDGSLDAFCGLLKTPERQAKMQFLDTVLFSIRHKVAVRADDTVAVNNFDDIRKLPAGSNVIITTQGTAYVPFLESQGGLVIDSGSKDNSANLKKLLLDRGRFFYSADANLIEFIANDKLQDKVKILPAVFREENQFFVVSKAMPPASAEKLHQALDKLSKQGELAKIYKKYMP